MSILIVQIMFLYLMLTSFDIEVLGKPKNYYSNTPLSLTKQYQDYLKRILLVSGSTLAYSSSILALDYPKSKDNVQTPLSFSCQEAAEFIKSNCNCILSAAQSTGRLLYRGSMNSVGTSSAFLVETDFDLLDKDTYSSPVVADYFKYLNMEMQALSYPITPVSGHLATSDIISASEWGEPVSIWPLDKDFHYAWLRNEITWWNPNFGNPQGFKGPTFWRSPSLIKQFVIDEIQSDRGIEAALVNNHEILFGNTDRCRYMTVPLKYEPKLLNLLKITPFSNKIKIIKSQNQMELSGNMSRRIDPILLRSNLLY